MTMRLGLVTGYSGPKMNETMDVILEAERLGFDSVWTGEAWGSDVVSFLAFVGARTSTIKLGAGILQMQARTPAMTAMTAMTLDGLTNGRFLIGLGPSNPQVIEGWHGVPSAISAASAMPFGPIEAAYIFMSGRPWRILLSGLPNLEASGPAYGI